MADDISTGSSPVSTAVPTDGVSASTDVSPTATQDSTPAAAQQQGPIPFDRHKSILDGAYAERDTARREFEEYKQKYGWAGSIDPTEFQQLQRWSTAYREDPVRWMAETVGELKQQYPHLTPALTSEAARILAGSRGFQPEPEIEPDIPVLDAQGQVVSQAFSADRVKQLIARSVAEAIGREVGPLKQTEERRQAAEQARAVHAEATQSADDQFRTAQQWHGFKEYRASIEKAYAAHENWSLPDAYLHVLHTEILPKLSQTAQGQLLTHLQTQAAGSTVHPSGTSPTQPFRPKSFDEALRYFEAHPQEAEASLADR